MDTYQPDRPLPDNAPTVGIPRATLFFEMFPFWNAFFTELGLKTVTSSPTNRSIINTGCEAVVEEICFPIKVAHGHVQELLKRKVDYLLLPCVVNMEHLSEDSVVSYNCPFVQSFPYLVSSAIDFNSYSTKVLKPVLHFERGIKSVKPQLKKLAHMLGCRGAKVNRAINSAYIALQTFQDRLQQRGQEILNNLPRDRQSLVIVSRPYNGCDPGLNFGIPEKLRDLNALAIPLDFLPIQKDFGPDLKNMYWRYGQRIISASHTIAENPKLNAVYVTNFSCGPDSFITKYFNRGMKNKPFLTIELDEHSADAGVITRLEAFLDSLETARPHIPDTTALKKTKQRRSINTPMKVYLPHMDDHGVALAAAMRCSGIDAEALPMADEKTIEIGRRYTTGKECYPTTGDIVKKTQDNDFDPDGSSFFMPSAMGPCRFGQYNRFHRLVLDDLGFKNVPMILLDQTENYSNDLNRLGNGFRLIGWQSIILVDYLKKLLLQTRPYEAQKGESNAVYQKCLDEIVCSVEKKGALNGCTEFIAEHFSSIALNNPGSKPLIGIVGEIFVRSNQFSNDFFIRRIEELGGELVMPTLQEWVSYTDWERRKDFRRGGNYRAYLSEVLKNRIQEHYVSKISRPFKNSINHFFKEAPTAHIMDLCSSYCTEDIRGEANLSMGRAVEYALHGFHGIANLAPFNCMPGTIVNTLFSRFSKDYPQTPILKMIYDGTKQSSSQTRIEAFMHQVQQTMDESNGK